MELAIDRIAIRLTGVSEARGDEAATHLEEALRRRLAGLRPEALARLGTDTIARLDLGQMEGDETMDGRTLAAMIAERLVGRLTEGTGWH